MSGEVRGFRGQHIDEAQAGPTEQVAPTPKKSKMTSQDVGSGPGRGVGSGPDEIEPGSDRELYSGTWSQQALDDHFQRGMDQVASGLFGGGAFIKLLVQLGPAIYPLIQQIIASLGGNNPTPAKAPQGMSSGAWDMITQLANQVLAIGKPFALQFVNKLVQELIVQQLQGGGSSFTPPAE